jgi:RND superfamily putative drug exporter
MLSLTRWMLRHRRLVALCWILLAGIGLATSGNATNALSKQMALPGREGFETNQAILRAYSNGGDAAPIVPVIALPASATVDSPGVRAQLAHVFAALAATVPGARVASYADTGNRAFVSRDGRTTFGLIFAATAPGAATPATLPRMQRAAAGLTVAGAPVRLTGLGLLQSAPSSTNGPSLLTETLIGGLGALLVLILVFGSFLAVVPLLMAFVAIPTTFLLVWGLTAVTDVSFIVQFLISLIGLGVAIDYSLLIVMRWREERAAGLENEAAVARAMQTAGAAVVFSGTTVGIGLLALVALPVPALRSVGFGGLLIPLVSVAAALTLLPVVLASIGPRLAWPHRGGAERMSRFWGGWARLVTRNRWLAAAAALLVLGALFLPVRGMAIDGTRADALAQSDPAAQALHALETSGIGAGALSPIEILAPRAAAASLAGQLATVAGAHGAVAPSGVAWQQRGTALVDVLPVADGTSAAAQEVVDRVQTIAHRYGARVGGGTAQNADFVAAVYGSFPLVIALIVLVTFVLLMRAFRSIVLPLQALLLNVISIGAAWGVLTLVWQQGHGSTLIWGIPATGSITSWVPLMVFAFLFGLSMDYQVFILSRVREEYDRTGATASAVVRGIGHTGRLVTSAALILGLAFVSLAAIPLVDVKVMATGLAAGILLDATVVRMLLVPALVAICGRANWWLPAPMARVLGAASHATSAESADAGVEAA